MEEYVAVTKTFAIRWDQNNLDDIRRALIVYDPDIEISLNEIDPIYIHLKIDNLFVLPGEWILVLEEPDGSIELEILDHYGFVREYVKKD